MSDTFDFANRLKELRTAKGLTQRQLADLMFVSNGTVANWEHGFSVPDEELIDDIAAYFKVSRAELVGA